MLRILQSLRHRLTPPSRELFPHSEVDYDCALFICQNRENPRAYAAELLGRRAISQDVCTRLQATL